MNIGRVIGGVSLSFIFLSFFVYIIFSEQSVVLSLRPSKSELVGSVSDTVQNIENENAVLTPSQPALEVSAESAISVKSFLLGSDSVLFDKSSNKKLPIASLTKLMTAVIVLDNYDLSQKITVDELADLQSPMKQDVKLGDALTIENFLEIMLIESSNKSAYALAEGINGYSGEQKFVGLMNKKAQEIGLVNTFFADPTGLSSENVSTAGDLTKLAEYILKSYPKIADISKIKELYVPGFGRVSNTDQLLGKIPEIVCSKTGFTTEAKGCLLLVMNDPKDNGYFINVILGADDRFSEMKKIIDWLNLTCR